MINKTWSNIIFIVLDIAILVYVVLAMTSFNKPLIETNDTCSKLEINIEENLTAGFLTSDDIKSILMSKKIYPLGKPISMVSTREIEETLLENNLIESVLCYTTSNNHVIIELKQRTAVLRIKTDMGDDYYLDNNGRIIPKVQYPTDLIVATGNFSRKYAQKHLSGLGNILVGDNFWKDEIEQIYVMPSGTIEMIPRTGNHVIYLGEPTDIESKLERLYKFYKFGLNKIGWNKYSYINLEFDNQIICKKK